MGYAPVLQLASRVQSWAEAPELCPVRKKALPPAGGRTQLVGHSGRSLHCPGPTPTEVIRLEVRALASQGDKGRRKRVRRK